MTDAERMVWCAAFGAEVAAAVRRGDVHAAYDDALRNAAKNIAWRAVKMLEGPSRELSPDSMLLAATAEHGRVEISEPGRCAHVSLEGWMDDQLRCLRNAGHDGPHRYD